MKKYLMRSLMAVMIAVLLCSCSGENGTDYIKYTTSEASETRAETKSTGSETAASTPAESSADLDEVIDYDGNDYYTDWESLDPVYIEMSGTEITVSGEGADVSGSSVTVRTAGTYVLSGDLENGQVIVDAGDDDDVLLVFNGIDIYCGYSSPIYVMNADKVIITLQDGTCSTVTDGGEYELADPEQDEPNAAVFSCDDFTFNGTGTLTVNANYNNGIASKDDLKIMSGTFVIDAVDDGIIGRDIVLVKNAEISIVSGGDGIRSTNDIEEYRGYIVIEGGIFDITAGTDGIQAARSIYISGGEFSIVTGGGSANSSYKTDGGTWGKWNTGSSQESSEQSAKGLKAQYEISVSGGIFDIDSSDDAIHSNDTIVIEAGTIYISSGDDGIHADSEITIYGGDIGISKSYEGIESAVIGIYGGSIGLVSYDDGINIVGGNDGSSVGGRPGQNTYTSQGSNKLVIDGGYIAVDAAGDGVDINGSIYMYSGTLIISGPISNNNGPLDYDGTFVMNGGTLIAAGSAGMAQAPSDQSGQYAVIINFDTVQPKNTLFNLSDEDGNEIATCLPSKQYQSVVICSPLLKDSTSYVIYTGGSSTGDLVDGVYIEGSYTGGSKVVGFEISSIVTWLSENGVTDGKQFNPRFR